MIGSSAFGFRRYCAITGAAIVAMFIYGCTAGPDRIQVPDFDPNAIGMRAIESYDKDGDGDLSGTELAEVKSLESAMRLLDANGDAKLSADEIAARIRFYQEYRAGLVSADCTLIRAGRPVVGAKVTYEPEEFMGESVVPAYGTTDGGGGAAISVAEEHLPSPAHSGVQPGFYRVRVALADGTELTNLDAGVEVASGAFNNHRFVLP